MRTPLVVACMLFTAACGGGGGNGGITNPPGGGNPPTPSNNVVEATPSLQFTPTNISISVGQSVQWEFGSVAHTVSFQKAESNPDEYGGQPTTVTPPADIPQTANATVARTFNASGTYHYRCSIHPTMIATVTVQ